MEAGFDIVQLIDDFDLITTLALVGAFIWGMKSINSKDRNIHIRIDTFEKKLHEEHMQQREDISSQFSKMEKRQTEHYDRLWRRQDQHSDILHKHEAKLAGIDKDIEYLKTGEGGKK